MIVSASRRTDIPALYANWLERRVEMGSAKVPHPFKPSEVRSVDLRPPPAGPMEALVLWTRNPGPLLGRLPTWELQGIRTLWLVTITGYPRDLEPAAPAIEEAVSAVRQLAEVVGSERVSWRYDPLLLCSGLGVDCGWHGKNFRRLAQLLAGAVGRCIVSYYDDYAKARRRLDAAGIALDRDTEPLLLASNLAAEAAQLGLPLQSCCEEMAPAGIAPGACIDGALMDRLWSLRMGQRKDPGQRPGCRCAPSVDIGVYNTCTHGCLYCYATGSPTRARMRCEASNPASESLTGPAPARSNGAFRFTG